MKILVVDDEVVSRKKMEKIMTEFGECHIVESGKDAVDSFADAWRIGIPFDLISLDIGMPDISGIEVLTMIRSIEKEKALDNSQRVKVMMVTTHSDKDIVVNSMKAGCNNYIVKPFDRKRVVEKLVTLGFDIDSSAMLAD